ncbi:hypothetical protein T459_18612 [Capsicum annuum]|uniref:Disease resistance R13L4/SHOC-2-like LRR domain-containing protein n=1 Tax=Capsicum annuum TaxID=4072 RepID=A0A2G2YZ98_CAPAN|nr:hypothetical protein T459_18612 [Capsicum annuum]
MQIIQPFKPVTGDKIGYCHDGLYRALLTSVHHQLRDHDNNDLLIPTRSIFSFHLKDLYHILKLELIHYKLLKVLVLRQIFIDVFPLHILSLIWLRYLSLHFRKKVDIPPEICSLWNLQTFIVEGFSGSVITFPEEIWGLMQLRHLKLPEFYLPNPPSVSADKKSHMGFSNIQTISYLSLDCCTKEVIMGIQNVKELGLSAYWIDSDGLLNNLVHLQQLQTLSLTYCLSRSLPASAKAFPATLKKLKLERTWLSWSYLDIIAELPNLEVLKLMVDACDGEEWHPNVRGFTRLKLLLIEENFLQYWKATDDNFPILEHLVLKECMVLSHHNDDDEEEEEDSDVDVAEDDDDDDDSDVDVAEDDDDSDVDVAEDDDSDADAAKHDDSYDLNWLFDVQNNLALLTPVHRQLRDHDALSDENFVMSLTHTNDDNSPLRRIRSIFLFAAPSLNTFSLFVESVSGLLPYCCTKKVLSGIQNIKKLCIRGHVYDYDMREEVMDFREIVDLHQLETLSIKVDRYHVSHWSSRSHKSTVCVPNATHFPTKLKKLKLVATHLTWEDLNIIGQWPNLEVLKLKANACHGLE